MSLTEVLLTIWLIFIIIIFVIFYLRYKYENKEDNIIENDVYLTEEHRELLRRRNESVRD